MKTFTRIIFAFIIAATFGSCASTYIRSGKEAYNDLMYKEAIKNLDKGLAKKMDFEGLKVLANSYMKINNFDKATETFETLVNQSGVSDTDRVEYAMALMSMKKYDKAREQLNKINNNKLAAKLLASLDNHKELVKDSALFIVEEISLPGLDMAFSPVISKDRLIVSAAQSGVKVKDPYTNLSYVDLYEVRKSGETWGKPKKLHSSVNEKYHDGTATFSADGKTMIFSRSNYVGKNKLGKDLVNVNNIQLYETTQETDSTWSKPNKLKFSDDQFMFATPALSPDGNTLYFSSDIPDGFGGMDLYKVVKKENGRWDKPVNLGPSINTEGQEVFPTLRGNDSLFFSSDAHQTIGGLDLVYAVNKNGAWSTPTHLSYPINSSEDDLGIIFSEMDKGYFSSDRSGADKIYSFEMFNPEIKIIAVILDEETGLPIENTKVIIRNLTDDTEYEVFTDRDGKFTYDLLPGKRYQIETINEAYFKNTTIISTEGITEDTIFDESYNLKLLLPSNPSNTSVEGVYTINNIYWDYNKWEIRPDAEPYLMDLVKLFNDNQNLDIEIQSHCDCRGGRAYNKKLSQKRASAVVDYLVSKGIPRRMLKSKGYGKDRLKIDCECESCSDSQHQENRRTEFVVTDIKK